MTRTDLEAALANLDTTNLEALATTLRELASAADSLAKAEASPFAAFSKGDRELLSLLQRQAKAMRKFDNWGVGRLLAQVEANTYGKWGASIDLSDLSDTFTGSTRRLYSLLRRQPDACAQALTGDMTARGQYNKAQYQASGAGAFGRYSSGRTANRIPASFTIHTAQ